MLKRASGLSVASVAGVLAITGYALYYTIDLTHDAAAVIHKIVGGAAILFALIHGRRYRPRGALKARRLTAAD